MTRYAVPDVAPQHPHCTEIVIRRSRFLTQCAHTPDAATARAFVEQARRQHTDATHNCWAYAAGAPGNTAQIGSSDDGEPHGTAGRPMRLGEGTGGAVAYHLLRCAASVYNDMATFSSAGVAGKTC